MSFGIPTRNGLPLGLGTVASLASRATAAVVSATDTFFRYVTLLLNTTSTNGAQNNTFLDSSTNNFSITRNGDTTQGSFNPYMPSGYWSGFFDGTGDYLTAPSNTNLSLSTSATDFTIEAWVNPNSFGGAVTTILALWPQTPTGRDQYILATDTMGALSFYWAPFNTASVFITGGTLQRFTWAHIAVTRSGNTFRLFLNGTQVASGTSTGTAGSDDLTSIGRYGDGATGASSTSYWNGYISNARIVKGTAVYTSAFTPPTAPLTAITNTSLLCLQDNRFIDRSTNAFAITVNGDTRISKFAPFNPPASYSPASYGGSGYFDGNGDELNAGSNAAFSFGTGAYTVECWVFLTAAVSATHQPFFVSNSATNGFAFWNENGANQLQIASSGVGGVVTSATTLTANIWNHIVAVRSGTGANQTAIFVNGTRVANGTDATNWTVTGPLKVGGITAANFYLTGYQSNVRVVKGTAVYDPTQTTLTVPTTPLTAITNTSLLLNFTNAGIFDAATINNGQTVGNAQVSTTQAKWSPTSMSFDGTGDNLTTIDKPELRIGTGDFTIEGWVYLNATGVAYGLVSKGTATTGWSVNVTSGNKLQFSYTATQLTGATSLASGTWYYFAVVRSGTASGNLRVILDGATDATSAGAVNDNFNQTNVLYVGADRVAGAVLNGYLQDVRITNGYARTTSTPTAAFPTL
jgi:hypothetical protein